LRVAARCAALRLGLVIGLLVLVLVVVGGLLGLDNAHPISENVARKSSSARNWPRRTATPRVGLLHGDLTVLVSGVDQLLHRRVRQVEQGQRRIGSVGDLFLQRFGLRLSQMCGTKVPRCN
jgi:hypothetical protein